MFCLYTRNYQLKYKISKTLAGLYTKSMTFFPNHSEDRMSSIFMQLRGSKEAIPLVTRMDALPPAL